MNTTLGLHNLPGRCSHGYAPNQHPTLCPCPGIAAAAAGMAQATAAHPTDAALVESAIRKLAAAGSPFSANDARLIHGVRGGVVGATFNALRAEKVIRPVGSEISTDRGTHGKPVALWTGEAA